jgi:D-aminoacyl-tRNA deacylase
MFVELGSGEQQWSDPDAAAAVARAVLTLDTARARHPRTVVCFGGGHYAPRPTRIARETDWAVGHVAADWALSAMGDPDPQVVEAAFEHSGAERAVVAGDRPALVGTVTDLGYQVVGETWVRETEGVPAALVDRLEDALTPVAEGLRFGAPARGDDANREFVVAELPADLLDAAHGIDRGAAVEAVAGVALAYETAESGNRVAGRAAFPEQAARTRAVDRLAGVLAREYDTVEREADAVVARREVFDPELARTLGVPEGPAFGRLADGEPVTVDGREIPPETVTRERVERFER